MHSTLQASSRSATTIISTISLVTFITFLSATSTTTQTVAASTQQLPQQQPQQVPLQEQQQQQQGNQNEVVLRQLMRLAVAEQQQQAEENALESSTGGQLKMRLLEGPSKKQLLAAKPSKLGQDNKSALKRKWHKLVDDLIDQQDEQAPREFAVGQPMARRRPLAASNAQQVAEDDSAAASSPKLVILVKRKPDSEGNGLGDLFAAPSSEQQQQTARNVNMEQHQRRILNDDFGIRKDSVFTSNNHLGLKGVPKFGSEEQF